MKIAKVTDPESVTHYHNGRVYSPKGTFFKLTATDKEFYCLPERVQNLLRDRWARYCQVNGGSIDCYLKPTGRWRLLAMIAGDGAFGYEFFLDYVYVTRGNAAKVTGKRAWALICRLFGANSRGEWPYLDGGGYVVERTNEMYVIVPGPVFGRLLATDNYQKRLEEISEKLSTIVHVSFPK